MTLPAIPPSQFVAGVSALASLPWNDIADAASAHFASVPKDLIAAEDIIGFFATFFPGLQIAGIGVLAAEILLPLISRGAAADYPSLQHHSR